MKKYLLAILFAVPFASYANVTIPAPAKKQHVAVQSTIKDLRPAEKDRLFRSDAVERQIVALKEKLTAIDPKLYWMFTNCFPNTLDTTVHYSNESGDDDTFVYTGDIHAMWLRDSGAQVWPYLRYVKEDEPLRHLIRGVIRRQIACILIDPYANAFNMGPTGGEWQTDETKMKKELHERKYEIDSLCYPIRLAYEYWLQTGDASIFDDKWLQAVRAILDTFREQQNWNGYKTSYKFRRNTKALHDTRSNNGYGHPGKPCGLIASAFRPSDDSTIFPYLVPSNFFAVSALRKASAILRTVNKQMVLASECDQMAMQVEQALKEYAVVEHPKYGKIYAFEVDGYGSSLLMDDSNAPSLLCLPYLCDVPMDDPIYQNTRRFIWSEDNPYFFRGKAGEGIGGPHCGLDMPWPMSVIMKALTTEDRAEQEWCVKQLMATDAGTGFMHESFHKDDAKNFTRSWFAWVNTLFGELIVKMYAD
ncbi:MAG: glycoside hydrolase family 125 protein [Bacteroidaceae bacterium]|nr:glycoside hydrolase family 125 protein [Bacteroidaceae bacterium]